MLLLPCLPPVVQRGGGTGLSIEFNERRAGVATSADAAVAQWSNRTAFLLQAADSEQQFVNTGAEWKAARVAARRIPPR